MLRWAFVMSAAGLLAGCAHSQAQPERPAVIEKPGDAARAELQSVVAGMLGVNDVVLAANALTQSAVLFVEQGNQRDASGRQLDGRNLGRPEEFHLLRSGTRCVLLHVNKGTRRELRHIQCRAL
jgi:hypothetical protein